MLKHSRLLRATLPLTLAALGATQSVNAQTSASASSTGQTRATDTAGIPDADATGDIVVTGSYARSLAAATETKRQAGYGVDAINATDIGKFPAQNVAEVPQLILRAQSRAPAARGCTSASVVSGRSSKARCSTGARWRSTI